jgi:hypothetical protein
MALMLHRSDDENANDRLIDWPMERQSVRVGADRATSDGLTIPDDVRQPLMTNHAKKKCHARAIESQPVIGNRNPR